MWGYYKCRGVVPARLMAAPPAVAPRTEATLRDTEALHRVYDLYIWLAFRFEERAFPGRQAAQVDILYILY